MFKIQDRTGGIVELLILNFESGFTMDILAARKKAADMARAKAAEEAPAQPVPFAPVTESVSPTPEPVAAPAGTVQAAPSPERTLLPDEAEALLEPADIPAEIGHEEVVSETEAAVPDIEMLSFRLGSEEYAILVNDVHEVLKTRDLTPVPNTPDYLLGVTSLRGTMLPVIDLCIRLNIASGGRDDKSRIIVVGLGDEDVGLIVDRVTGVIRVTQDAVKPSPEHIEQGAEFLRGIVRKNDKLYIVLDLQKTAGAG